MPRKYDVNNINLQINNVDFWSPHVGNKGGMKIYWSSDIGFGELAIVKRNGNDGEDYESQFEELLLTAETEYMDRGDDREFTDKIMSLLTEKLKVSS